MFNTPHGHLATIIEDVAIDGDDPTHIQWIFEKAEERADQYNIRGVTYRLTQGGWVWRLV